MKTTAYLPDGSLLSAGTEGASIEKLVLTESVNAGQELTLGSVCCAVAELTVLSPQELSIQAGDTIELSRMEGHTHYLLGLFIAEEPVRISKNRLKITAYDNVSLLDKDVTAWLEALPGWPYTPARLAKTLCTHCGITLRESSVPYSDYKINKFHAGQITGRQVISWIAELLGCFCRADKMGRLEFGWYYPKDVTLMPGGEHFYLADSLKYQQYTVEPIGKVHIRQNEEDVGTVYPDTDEQVNTYTITGNPLAAPDNAEALIGIAQTLYERLQNVSYTPCRVSVLNNGLNAGDIISVQGADGNTMTVYVMKRTLNGDKNTVEAVGSIRRSSTTAVNSKSLATLSGKVLNLKTTVDGLSAENRDAAGRLASLSLDVSAIASEVSRQQTNGQTIKTQLTELTQKADSVELQVQTLTQNGTSRVQTETGFTFDEQGLTISRSGSQIENLLDETGMYVKRQGNVILQANQDGVRAVDVTVQNYLIVGDHARFEDYSNGSDTKRTACYWI